MTTQQTLDERYGRSRPGLRMVTISCSVAVAAIFGGWLAWTAWFHGTPEVRSALVAFEIRGQHEAAARVDVRLRDEQVEATCKLRAIAYDHTVVGELNFTVPADDFVAGRPLERSVRTIREATAVEMVGCTTADQPRPR